MLDHGPFGVDLDNHVLEIDVRQQHPILRAWVASLMADFLGAVVAYAEAWARRILCLTSLRATSIRVPDFAIDGIDPFGTEHNRSRLISCSARHPRSPRVAVRYFEKSCAPPDGVVWVAAEACRDPHNRRPSAASRRTPHTEGWSASAATMSVLLQNAS